MVTNLRNLTIKDVYNVVGNETFTEDVNTYALVLKATGGYYFAYSSGFWRMFWFGGSDSTATLWPKVIINPAGAHVLSIDYFRVPADLWLPTPLAYDTFTRADGVLGSSQTVGPDGQAAPARAWANLFGTSAISTNKAVFSALESGQGMAVVDVGTRNSLISCKLTRSAGSVGIMSYASNAAILQAYHDGTNVILGKWVDPAWTVLVNVATAYAAGAELRIIIDGNAVSVFYNGFKVGTTQIVSDASLLAATKAGLYTTDTGNSFDNFQVFARGTGGEYTALNRYIGA